MKSKVAPFAAAPDSTYGRQTPSAALSARGSADGVSPSEEADVRLVIEEDEASGAYIYTTINRRTGEVLQRLRHEQVERLAGKADYHAGIVIRTKA